jgi:hypothetical protein
MHRELRVPGEDVEAEVNIVTEEEKCIAGNDRLVHD